MFHTNRAQHMSRLGRFSIDYPTGCAPVTISISENDQFGNISRQYFYEPNIGETTDTFHTYNRPGVYKIVQFLGEDVRPKSDTLIFEVLENIMPGFEILQCSGSQYKVKVTDGRYDYYLIQFSKSDKIYYWPGDDLPTRDNPDATSTVTVKGLYNDSYPTCSESNISFNPVSSPTFTISDINIQETCKNQYFLKVGISTFDANQILRISATLNDKKVHLFQGKSQKQMTIPLGYQSGISNPCIEISLVDQCDSATIKSEKHCRINTLEFKSLDSAYASYDGNSIKIVTGNNPVGEVAIYRKADFEDSFSFVANASETFTDKPPSRSRHYNYKLVQEDTCGFLLIR